MKAAKIEIKTSSGGMMNLLLTVLTAGIGLSALAGCASNPPAMTAIEARAPVQGYLLDAGDKLHITVFNELNLTGDYNITSAGNVAFPLIGTIPAKGLPIEAVEEAIRTKLAGGYVNDPRVSIEVLNYRPFYILGEVNKPGEFPFVNGMTVEQAIASAGGFTYRANRKTVFVRRAQTDGERSVALRTMAVPVLPGDTIRIGERYF